MASGMHAGINSHCFSAVKERNVSRLRGGCSVYSDGLRQYEPDLMGVLPQPPCRGTLEGEPEPGPY